MPNTERGVRKKGQGWVTRKRSRGKGLEYHISSLPDETRAHLAAASFDASAPAQAGVVEGRRQAMQSVVESRSATSRKQQGLADVMKLSDKARARMDARLAVLRLVDQFIQMTGMTVTQGQREFCDRYNRQAVDVPADVRQVIGDDITSATIYRWRARLRKSGAAALAGSYGRRAENKQDAQHSDIRNFVVGMLHDHPHATGRHIHRGITARFGDDKCPSKRTIDRWVSRWKQENAQLLMAVSNPDGWRSRYRAAGGDADEHVVRVNQLWELDSTPGDILLADGSRHAIIGCIDVYTRRLKLHVSRTSQSTAIASLIRRCLMDWGVPETARTDEGSDYISKHIKWVFSSLDVEHHILPPFSPERKPFIERALGTFSHDLVELLAGYIGHSVADRKAIESRKSFAERMMGKGADTAELRLTPEELQTFCDQWTDTIYAHDAHSGLGGKTPFRMASDWVGTVRCIDDERALDVLLAAAPGDGYRTISKKGLRIDRGTYDHPDLGGLEGNRVRVLLDEYDYGYIYVFAESGEFICKAFDPRRTGISRMEVAKKRRQVQQQVMSAGKKELKKIAREAGTKDIVQDILADRAESAGKLARLPQPSSTHTTPALEEASRAAGIDRTPKARELTPEERRIQAEIVSNQVTATVTQLRETPEQRYCRAVVMERAIAAGEQVSDHDRTWLGNYQKTPEYRGTQDFYASFGLDPLEVNAQ